MINLCMQVKLLKKANKIGPVILYFIYYIYEQNQKTCLTVQGAEVTERSFVMGQS